MQNPPARKIRAKSELPVGEGRKVVLAAIAAMPSRFTKTELRDYLGAPYLNNILTLTLQDEVWMGRLFRVRPGEFRKITLVS